MSSKQFKKTVKSVSKNFEKYTTAMEADIQVLINSVLDLIESKIISLRKLLKLKLCISNVKSISALNQIVTTEDTSVSPSGAVSAEPNKKLGGSLEDLSSMIYEVDKDSLPIETIHVKEEDARINTRLKYLEDIADLENLCSALNQPNRKMSTSKKNHNENPRVALDKYIYLLLDAEKRKEKEKITISNNDTNNNQIGDFIAEPSQLTESVENTLSLVKNHASQDGVVYLAKSEYESLLDILNMVLDSYRKQEKEVRSDIIKMEKSKTETIIIPQEYQEDERKHCSDSKCKQKESSSVGKKVKSRKSCCL